MILTITTAFLILAILFFLLDAFHVAAAVGWTSLAWACFMLAILFGLR